MDQLQRLIATLPRRERVIPIARWLLLAAIVLLLVEVLERRTAILASLMRRKVRDARAIAEEEEDIQRRVAIPLTAAAARAMAGAAPMLGTPPPSAEPETIYFWHTAWGASPSAASVETGFSTPRRTALSGVMFKTVFSTSRPINAMRSRPTPVVTRHGL